jgi:hypothetical protein
MFINYFTFREIFTGPSSNGEAAMEKYNLCFSCAVAATVKGEIVKSIITENEHDCDDCSL